jgi:peptidoglycan/xylan/chitin deacetylase (PgdA/CDA1 family)
MNVNFFKSGDAILNYHRICSDSEHIKKKDELTVSVSKFKQQLNFLKKNYHFVSLDNFIKFEKSKKKNISITFDDGYKDNLTYALPVLKELDIPATIYIVTKFLKGEFDIWWYELKDYISESSEDLKFSFEKNKYNFSIRSESEKIKCFNRLNDIIQKLNKKEQYNFLKELTNSSLRKQYKNILLSKEDLSTLISNPLITLGAHSHNHLSLRNLSKEECVEEIKKSKQTLEELMKCKVNHFSYPYGGKNDVGEREFEIVKELGFDSAVVTSVGKISKKKIFNLPRVHMSQRTNLNVLKFKLSIFYYFYIKFKKIINLLGF